MADSTHRSIPGKVAATSYPKDPPGSDRNLIGTAITGPKPFLTGPHDTGPRQDTANTRVKDSTSNGEFGGNSRVTGR